MSNFNLISPEGNGFNFNVRFDEPIIVPENASVHMNWCQFERDNLINFTEAQTITLKNPQVLPYFDWKNDGAGKVGSAYRINGVEKNAGDFTFTIPAGKYSVADLQTQIINSFTENSVKDGTEAKELSMVENITETRIGIDTSKLHITNESLKFYNYELVCPTFEPDPSYLEMGFALKTKPTALNPDPDHKHNVSIDSRGIVKKNGGADGTFTTGLPDITAYNCYGMGRHKYIHTGGHFQQYIQGSSDKDANIMKSGGFDELQNVNTINFRSNKEFEDTNGSVFVGLYIQGYAGATDNSVIASLVDDPLANRIHDGNMIAKRNSVTTAGGYYPKCHFGVEYSGFNIANLTDDEDNKLNIIHAQMSADSMEGVIDGMERVMSIDISQYRDVMTDNSHFAFGIQTYFDKGNSNRAYSHADEGSLHIRVFIQQANGTSIVVYDTNTKYPHFDTDQGQYIQSFSKAFMNTYVNSSVASLQADTINLAQAQSTIPFVPIVSATHTGEGGKITYLQMFEDSSTAVVGDDSNSLLIDYQLEMSNQIGNLFQPLGRNSTYTTPHFSPSYIDFAGMNNYINTEITNIFSATIGQNEFYFRENNILGQYRQDKFSVVLNNLPIKSYKNTNDKTKSGYRKPILANIPNPFAGADMSMGNSGKILGSYQSSLGIVNRLSNQAITTNNFDVLILDLETDKPAEQLTKTIVNFTITAD